MVRLRLVLGRPMFRKPPCLLSTREGLVTTNYQLTKITLRSGKFHCFFVFGWIKLKFDAKGNFRLLISNLNSKMQYRFEILRKCHFSSLRS